jgi:ATP-dependent RNA helicase DeaD
VEHAATLWELLPDTGPASVIVCADAASAAEWADSAPETRPVHSVAGLARTQAVLKSRPPAILAGATKDLAQLVARSALKLDSIHTIVIAWPEGLAPEHEQLLDQLLAEAKDSRRIVLAWDPSRVTGILERHAHRAPVVGNPDLDASGRPAPPVGPARFAVVSRDRRAAAVRQAIEVLDARHPLVWRRGVTLPSDPVDAVLCVDLPSRAEFTALARLAQPVLLLSATQLPYARSIAAPLQPIILPSGADLAQDKAEAMRAQVALVLERGDVDAELALLHPLFERYDPAQVAAAMLAISRQPAEAGHLAEPVAAQAPGWVKVWVGVGKKDRASAKDLVGALIREAGLSKEEIGRIDVRDSFALVDLAAGAADKAVRGLAGATIRGRRVAVRRDRA